MHAGLIALAVIGFGGSMAAQGTPVPSSVVSRASATITAADLARYFAVFAADSMRGRATPSLELERTARYVAAQFQQFGLAPGAGEANRVWHYPVPGQLPLDYVRSEVRLAFSPQQAGQPILGEDGGEVWQPTRLTFATAVYFAPEVGSPLVAERFIESVFSAQRTGSAHSVVLAGRYTAASVPVDTLRDQVVVYVPAPDADSATRRQVLTRLYEASAGVIVVSNEDSAHFVAVLHQVRQQPVRVVESFMRAAMGPRRWPWAVVVRAATAARILAAAGVDLAELRADPTPVMRLLPQMAAWLDVVGDTTRPRQTAPVVTGVLEGTDSLLKREYVVVMTHLDADGARARSDLSNRTDRGADDNTSGIAGLLALAKAFSQPGARPRRSLLFVATSGGASGKQAWGANASLDSWGIGPTPYPAPPEAMTGVLSLDMIGRLAGAGDSVTLDGLEDVTLLERPEWMAVAHPELGLTVRDGGTVVRPTSDHFPFVRRGVPSLFVHTGTHAELAEAGPVDTAQTARIVKLVFYLAETIANADQRPRWSATGRARLAAVQQP